MRWLGMLMVLLGCTGFGVSYYRKAQKRCELLSEMLRMAYMLRREIVYHKATLGEAFEDLGGQVMAPFSLLCAGMSRELSMSHMEQLQVIMTQQCRRYLIQTALKKEDVLEFIRLGGYLGYLDTQMQVQNLDLFISDLEVRITGLKEGLPRLHRLCWYLGSLGGVLLVLLLL